MKLARRTARALVPALGLLLIGAAAVPAGTASAGTGDPQVYAKTGQMTAHGPGLPAAAAPPWQTLVGGEVGVGLYTDDHWAEAVIAAPMPAGAAFEMWSGAGTSSGGTCVVAETHHQRVFQEPGPNAPRPVFFSMLKKFDDPSPAWDCGAVWITDPVTPTQPTPPVHDQMVGALTDQVRESSLEVLRTNERRAIVRDRWTPVLVQVYNSSPFPIGPAEVTGRGGRHVQVRGTRIGSIPPFSVRPARLQMRTDARGERRVRVRAVGAGAESVSTAKVLAVPRPPRLAPGRYEAVRGRMFFVVERSRTVRDLHGRINAFCGGSGSPLRTTATFPSTRVPRLGVVGAIRRTRGAIKALSLRVLDRRTVRMELVVTPAGPLGSQECGGAGSFTVSRVGRR